MECAQIQLDPRQSEVGEAEGERTSLLIRIPVRGVKLAETPDKTNFRHVSCTPALGPAYHKGHGDVREHPPHLQDVLREAGVGPVVHHQARVVTHGPVRRGVTRLQTQGIYISNEKFFQTLILFRRTLTTTKYKTYTSSRSKKYN